MKKFFDNLVFVQQLLFALCGSIFLAVVISFLLGKVNITLEIAPSNPRQIAVLSNAAVNVSMSTRYDKDVTHLEKLQTMILDWIWTYTDAQILVTGHIQNVPSLQEIKNELGERAVSILLTLLNEFSESVHLTYLFWYDEYVNEGKNWFDNINAVVALEELQPGSVSELSSTFGLLNFFRYEPQMLIDQLSTCEDNLAQNYALVINPYADHNGAYNRNFRDFQISLLDDFANAGITPVFLEAANLTHLSWNLERLEPYFRTKAALILQCGHGNPHGISLFDGKNICANNLEEYSGGIGRFCDDNTEIVLASCSTGSYEVEDNIASLIAQKTGLRVFALTYDSAITKISINENSDVIEVLNHNNEPLRVFN